ncbi:unnamed protein product, partial [Protopolystoma xenopodis]
IRIVSSPLSNTVGSNGATTGGVSSLTSPASDALLHRFTYSLNDERQFVSIPAQQILD